MTALEVLREMIEAELLWRKALRELGAEMRKQTLDSVTPGLNSTSFYIMVREEDGLIQ